MKLKSNHYSKFALGVALVVLGVILISSRYQLATHLQANSFADEPVEVIGFSHQEIEEEKLPKRIIIPALSVDLGVNKSEIKGGYWQVFPDAAGWGEGSGLPGEAGNQVIFAHAREGLFLPLRKIEEKTNVYVLTDEGWYAYAVTEIKQVYPNQTEVIQPTDDERLTLYTCSGFADSKRLIVIAKRV